MGGNMSTTNNDEASKDKLKPKSLSQILDYISTKYILTMDFKSLRNLYDKKYCDNLVILTSDIVERYFTTLEITYLAQRIKNGVEINNIEKDNMIFFNKDDLANMDIQNSIKKKRICNSIAKFYIKIAHIFAAIVTTINPIYVYKDAEGNTARANLYEKGKIPHNAPRNIYKLNICDNRINTLINNQDFSNITEQTEMNIHPNVCSSNVNDAGDTKTLEEEPGIPELMELYLDDAYDYTSGKFTGMLPKTQQIFREDLKIFYDEFTGNDKNKPMPPEITKFSDIKLKSFQNTPNCKGDDPILRRPVKGNTSNKLFFSYANNLKQMIQTANSNQNKLLNVLNEIFVYTVDPQTNKKKIRISPTLTEAKLQQIVIETRALIIKLYVKCEIDYTTGVKMYESIVNSQILETAKNQIKTLETMADTLITDTNAEARVPQPAELKIIQENDKNNIQQQKNDIDKQLENVKKNEERLSSAVI